MEEGRQKSKILSYTANSNVQLFGIDIVWEGVVEDKDDNDWVESTDNASVMSDDGESDE
jgi:hypothetical protein